MFVDIFVLIVVLISMVIAFLRGFIREILTIFGILGGILASYIGGPLIIPYMNGWVGVTEENATEKFFDVIPYVLLAEILSYGAILIVFVIILSIISHFLAEAAKNLGLGVLDRTLGVIFGFVRAVFVLGLMYLPFFYIAGDEQKEEWFAGSKTHLYLEISALWIDGFIPKEAIDDVNKGVEEIQETSNTRKKFEELDLLKSKSDEESKKDGYSPEFRENMDKMFKNNAAHSLND